MSLAPSRLLRRARAQHGHTLVELLAVMVILSTILTALTALFVSGARAELDLNRRFEAQQQARVAVDRLRRELHCASGIVSSAASITVTIPGHCPTAVGAAETTVVYSTQSVTASRYTMQRAVNGGAQIQIADRLTDGDVFAYTAPTNSSLGQLNVDVNVNVNPIEGWKSWHLVTDIVLRNTVRDDP